MAGLSVQMVNSIEGHRAWVSDKTLVNLAATLGLEVYQLFTPDMEYLSQKEQSLSRGLLQLRQDIKVGLIAGIDAHFDHFFKRNVQG